MEHTVLILSNDFEVSTNEVLKWIKMRGFKFYRINDTDQVKLKYLYIDDKKSQQIILNVKPLTGAEFEFNLNQVTSFWYRRGGANLNQDEFVALIPDWIVNKDEINRKVQKFIRSERQTINEYLYFYLENFVPTRLGRRSNSRNNKLIHFEMAKRAGLNVPRTFIGAKMDFFDFSDSGYVNKAISDGIDLDVYTKENNVALQMYTNLLPNVLLNQNETFNWGKSLIQEALDKLYELRIFYLEGFFYSMAIFSQKDDKTKIDFRRYNNLKPNRCTPYKLPEHIETRLHSFMQEAGLNTGSIDLVVTKDKKYYFLEVNPVGQFGMVSYPCNYQLEKKIANYLCKSF